MYVSIIVLIGDMTCKHLHLIHTHLQGWHCAAVVNTGWGLSVWSLNIRGPSSSPCTLVSSHIHKTHLFRHCFIHVVVVQFTQVHRMNLSSTHRVKNSISVGTRGSNLKLIIVAHKYKHISLATVWFNINHIYKLKKVITLTTRWGHLHVVCKLSAMGLDHIHNSVTVCLIWYWLKIHNFLSSMLCSGLTKYFNAVDSGTSSGPH